jgi:NAD(P)-dependent dehydrogenase (short-subunit alcohol dehydrogenase family)
MDKVVLVTGGSRGIGAAVARRAAQAGWKVALNYHSSPGKADAVAALIQADGGTVETFRADMGDPGAIEEMFAAVDKAFGRIDALVNNAGIIGAVKRVDEQKPEDLARLWAVNLTGYVIAAQAAVKRMSTRHGGRGGVIVNLSSIAARTGGMPGMVPYALTKGGIDSFTIGLAREVGREGIRVVAVRPGLIDTEIHEIYGKGDAFRAAAESVPCAGRAGTAAEVAEAVVWLMSDQASYVSATTLDVSSGR